MPDKKAKKIHLEIIRQGVKVWNDWRQQNPNIRPQLNRLRLGGVRLNGINLKGASLVEANFRNANLRGANLSNANLRNVNLSGADLKQANFESAGLANTNLIGANLTGANFRNAFFLNTLVGFTIFVDNDFEGAKGLDTVSHVGPSSVGVDTLCRSGRNIPSVFLSGCGVPDPFITYLPALTVGDSAVNFYSCFISYSHKDEDFTKRLHSRLRDIGIRVWFAPEDVKGGEKLHDQIEQAIQVHDRLLLVLSENSLQSEWVMTEIRNARSIESESKRRKLFPIRLVDFDTLRKWKCYDADTGKDLAVEVREYFIPDFSTWKDHDTFEAAFEKLSRDLKAE